MGRPDRRVDPHGFFPASQLDARAFREPGTYRILFVYSTKSDDIAAWLGSGGAASAEVARLFEKVPRVEARSSEFVLTVVPRE